MKVSELTFKENYEHSHSCFSHSSSVKNIQSLWRCDSVVWGCLTECLKQAGCVCVCACGSMHMCGDLVMVRTHVGGWQQRKPVPLWRSDWGVSSVTMAQSDRQTEASMRPVGGMSGDGTAHLFVCVCEGAWTSILCIQVVEGCLWAVRKSEHCSVSRMPVFISAPVKGPLCSLLFPHWQTTHWQGLPSLHPNKERRRWWGRQGGRHRKRDISWWREGELQKEVSEEGMERDKKTGITGIEK